MSIVQRPKSLDPQWVCRQNNDLDIKDNDITFVVKANKRIEAILIHHFGISKMANGKEQGLLALIGDAEQFLERDTVNKLHMFRKTRNQLVYGESNQVRQFERNFLEKAVLDILKSLDKHCNCLANAQTLTSTAQKRSRASFRNIKEVFILPELPEEIEGSSPSSSQASTPEPCSDPQLSLLPETLEFKRPAPLSEDELLRQLFKNKKREKKRENCLVCCFSFLF